MFLDFDGCCHRDRAPVDEYFRRSEQFLEPWLRSHADVDVVVSSSWREHYPLYEMREFFADDLKSRIISTTPILRRDTWTQYDGELPPIRFEREAEVTRWLHQSAAPWRPWVALDDQPWLYAPFSRHLVVCDAATGMSQHDLDQAETILRGQR